jgi:GT2 family glycosyltransferase
MPVNIDIIILSYAKNEALKALTIQAIDTLMASEDPQEIKFSILVIESEKSLNQFQYPDTITIYPPVTFGFNKYMNIGIKATNAPYVCLCNNDLLFHKNWATNILKSMYGDPKMLSATPYCPRFHKNAGFAENAEPIEGYFGVLTGWCIFVKREIFDIIGLFDEKLLFWYCDYDYCNTLEKYKVKNSLVSSAFVTHLGSESLSRLSTADQKRLTQLPRFYFSYKWSHQSYLKYLIQTILYKLNIAASTLLPKKFRQS